MASSVPAHNLENCGTRQVQNGRQTNIVVGLHTLIAYVNPIADV
jgi:hypothetical protein